MPRIHLLAKNFVIPPQFLLLQKNTTTEQPNITVREKIRNYIVCKILGTERQAILLEEKVVLYKSSFILEAEKLAGSAF